MPPFVPGIVPGTNRVCPRDKPGEIGLPLCRIRRIPGFVPVFHRICPRGKLGLSLGQIRWKLGPTGQKSLCLCAFFLPDCQIFAHVFGLYAGGWASRHISEYLGLQEHQKSLQEPHGLLPDFCVDRVVWGGGFRKEPPFEQKWLVEGAKVGHV